MSKLRHRLKEVEKLEKEADFENRLIFQSLRLDSQYCFDDGFQKIYTWIPGKKVLMLILS